MLVVAEALKLAEASLTVTALEFVVDIAVVVHAPTAIILASRLNVAEVVAVAFCSRTLVACIVPTAVASPVAEPLILTAESEDAEELDDTEAEPNLILYATIVVVEDADIENDTE